MKNLPHLTLALSPPAAGAERELFCGTFYRCVVLKDACFDRDEEVHRVLVGKIFPAQAAVATVDEFIAGQRLD